MPELAEVEWYSREWDAGLGRRVTAVRVHGGARVFRGVEAGRLVAGLEGRALAGVKRHGKQLLFGFGGGGWLSVHLGMTGELRAERPDFEGGKHDHLVLVTADAALVFRDPRMFGRVGWDEGEALPDWWLGLPPEVLSKGFTVARVGEFLGRRRGTPLKALLLEQAMFPGVGNWMADEVVWRLRVAPGIAAGEVDPAAVHREVRAVARGAMRTIGRDWSDPPATWLFRHRWKDGGRCPRCGGELVREELRGRTACHCPACAGAAAARG
jgi:formamidopyrimidine-DNA glycosylase